MKLVTSDWWDESLWRLAAPIYEEAFPEKGRKPYAIIRSMFEKMQMAFLHVAIEEDVPFAMALSGTTPNSGVLIIDYAAVSSRLRRQGRGRALIEAIKAWALEDGRFHSLIIEAEAEETPANLERIRFWESCGFRLTDYVHHYIWVPEPYRAMYVPLRSDSSLTDDGESLFRIITAFHRKAYTQR